jgi:hypothetical protein
MPRNARAHIVIPMTSHRPATWSRQGAANVIRDRLQRRGRARLPAVPIAGATRPASAAVARLMIVYPVVRFEAATR